MPMKQESNAEQLEENVLETGIYSFGRSFFLIFSVSFLSKNVSPANFFTPLSYILFIYIPPFFFPVPWFLHGPSSKCLFDQTARQKRKPGEDEHYLYIVRFLYEKGENHFLNNCTEILYGTTLKS